MSKPASEPDLFSAAGGAAEAPAPLKLIITLEAEAGQVRLEWRRKADAAPVGRARVTYEPGPFGFYPGQWEVQFAGRTWKLHSMAQPESIHARFRWLKRLFPVADADISARVPATAAPAREDGARCYEPIELPRDISPWTWLGRQIAALFEAEQARFGQRVRQPPRPDDPPEVLAARGLEQWRAALAAQRRSTPHLRFVLDHPAGCIRLEWWQPPGRQRLAQVTVTLTGRQQLTWEFSQGAHREKNVSSTDLGAIRAQLVRWLSLLEVHEQDITVTSVHLGPGLRRTQRADLRPWHPGRSPSDWLEAEIMRMADQLRACFSPPGCPREELEAPSLARLEKLARKAEEQAVRDRERQARVAANALRFRRQQEEKRRARERRARAEQGQSAAVAAASTPPPAGPAEMPPVPVRVELGSLEFQETLLPLADLNAYLLRERAARWWVSNQSDDLLCLPYCRIERLEYQLRAALRVLGPLRGRALLSDEVGLGKTIEAGLVLKELLTRGLVKRFLVLTVPSLVDQWREELADKFDLTTATTNQAAVRADAGAFWRENAGIVASLHTLKQPAHLAVAQAVKWDLLVVDEAHYLRNRDSQAWQAVNALPRQFLLLLTATPVQNSLDELYNLITLLQPGQLPSPKEFRARFVDPKRPRQPREPEELRRLLGQVMIRNTRANAGLQLPPRHAETVLFEPGEEERAFWQRWEAEFRAELDKLPASRASLWGRLLLQAAGSSPAAWLEALEKFPACDAAQRWRAQAPLRASWETKCGALPALARAEGGLVIFTQFLRTQAALAEALQAAGVTAFVVNGQTPPEQRQPITEAFRKHGGALLLTHSGTEGRNLQFCHRLVNFDLPWNPMEIEQRIGRLHRLGQRQPVRIYNFVQAGTLQEHLLRLLQEKLNLFELVVGETGLILGERFSRDEFAEEIFRRWRDAAGRVDEAFDVLGQELAAARHAYAEVKALDETLFAKDYESL